MSCDMRCVRTRVSPQSPKVRSACAKVRMCSSTFALSQICFWCPRIKVRCAKCSRTKVRVCSSTFALHALAMFRSRIWCSSTFALSHQHFALLGFAGTPYCARAVHRTCHATNEMAGRKEHSSIHFCEEGVMKDRESSVMALSLLNTHLNKRSDDDQEMKILRPILFRPPPRHAPRTSIQA